MPVAAKRAGVLPGRATAVRAMNRLAVMPQTGKLRWYIASMAIGAVLILGAVVITL